MVQRHIEVRLSCSSADKVYVFRDREITGLLT